MSYNITVITGSGSASYTVSTGARGPAGAAGQGVPTGGTTGQVLKKTSATPYATAWQDDEGGEALTFAGSDPNVGNVSGITVSGILTSNGSTQVVFPSLIAAADYAGKPQYTSAGDSFGAIGFESTHWCLYTTQIGVGSYWIVKQVSPSATWRGPIDGNEAGPENVTSWTPLGSATGTPTVSAITNAPTATFLGQYCKASTAWWQWNGTAWIQTHLLDGTPVAHTHAQLHDRQHAVTSASDHTFPGGTTDFLRADGTFATPPGGTVDNAAVNAAIATNPAASLRSMDVIGYNRQLDITPSDLWRPYVKMMRKPLSNLGPHAKSWRTVCLGDSVAVDVGPLMEKACGYGGSYITALNGVSSGGDIITDWATNMHGAYMRLNAAGEYIELRPDGIFNAVGLVYKAKNATGTLKLQYQTAKTGGWTDATNAWSISPKSDVVSITNGHNCIAVRSHQQLNVGDSVSGTGVPGGTTVTSVSTGTVTKTGSTTSGSATVTLNNVSNLAIGMRCSLGAMAGLFISSINPGANQITMSDVAGSTTSSQNLDFVGVAVTLSSNLTSTTTTALTFRHADCGSDSGSGLLNLNNGGADTLSVAWMTLPNTADAPNYYNVRVVNVSGEVDIAGMFFDNGSFGFGAPNVSPPQGGHVGPYFAVGGTILGDQHNATTQETWNRIFATLDPDIITYKTANSLSLSNLQAYWPGYAAKLRAAAPNALLVVIGSHASGTYPDRDAADMVACDNYWRDWCAETDGAIFIDLRANMPVYNFNTWLADGVWADGIHPYNGGLDWAAMVVWERIRPAVDAINMLQTFNIHPTRPIPGNGNEIRLAGSRTLGLANALNNVFSVLTDYSVDGYSLLRSNRSGTVSQSYSGSSGFGIKHGTSTGNTANELFLQSNNTRIQQWSTQRGFITGYGIPTDGTRANRGFRTICPNPVYNLPGIVCEGQNNQTTSILGIDINATTSAEGTPLWEWMPDGSVKNHGVVYKSSSVITLQGTATVLCTDTSGLVVGMTVRGINIPSGATISSINANTSFAMSSAATGSGSTNLAFTRSGTVTYTYEETGTNTTIRNAIGGVAGTGSQPRYQFAAPGYANAAGAAADTNLPSGALYYDESTGVGRIKP